MRICCAPVFLLLALFTAPGHAQTPPGQPPEGEASVTAEEALEEAEEIYGPSPPRDCPEPVPGEIVVCGEKPDDSEFRVRSSAELDPNHQNNNDGMPRAGDIPGMMGEGIFQGPATISGLCGLGCPPPMPVMIDFDALPETPKGSDADKVGKGELRGD